MERVARRSFLQRRIAGAHEKERVRKGKETERKEESEQLRFRFSMDLPLRAKRAVLIQLALLLCCVRLSSCKGETFLLHRQSAEQMHKRALGFFSLILTFAFYLINHIINIIYSFIFIIIIIIII